MAKFNVGYAEASHMSNVLRASKVFVNDQYQVTMAPPFLGHFPMGAPVPMVHLSIIPLNGQPVRSWSDLQAIKNELVGAENFAVEVYPAESRLVDCGANYHLWVALSPDHQPTFGWDKRKVLHDSRDSRVEEIG